MKARFILIAACAAVALASCTQKKFEPVSMGETKSPIAFEAPIVAPATKALPEGTGVYPLDKSFAVVGVYGATNLENWKSGEYYMYDESNLWVTVSHSQTTIDSKKYNTWTNTGFFWPKNGKLSFIAVSPASIASSFALEESEANAGSISSNDFYTVPTVGSTDEFMFSSRVNNVTNANQGNFGDTDVYGDDGSDDPDTAGDDKLVKKLYGVQLTFHHALSKIEFKAKLKEDYKNVSVKIKSIKLLGVHNEAKFDQFLTNTIGNEKVNTYGNPAWRFHRGAASYNSGDVVADDFTVTYNSGTPTAVPTQNLFVIPQTFYKKVGEAVAEVDLSSAKFQIEYSVTYPGGTEEVYGATEADRVEVALKDLIYSDQEAVTGTIEKAFKIGKKYTFNITIGFDGIYFAPVIENWATDVTVSGGIDIE